MSQAEETIKAKYNQGHPDFVPLCLEEMKLHSEKNADYARNGNPLGNFYRVSDTLKMYGINLPPSAVAFVYMMKQVDALGRMIGQNYDGQVEGTKGRTQDISIYSKLICILREEEKRRVN
jgi:hypothetical protein